MQKTLLAAKLHLARVTDANVEYEGSVAIDAALLEAAGIAPYEQVHIWDVTNGERLITYAIPALPGSRTICINGAGAHRMHKNDRVIIANFVQLNAEEIKTHHPKMFLLSDENAIIQKL